MYRIGIDLGGTNIAACIVDNNCRILLKNNRPTALPRTPEALAAAIFTQVSDLLTTAQLTFTQISTAGIGIPGSVNQQTGMVEYANNLGFDHVPFIRLLQEHFPCPLLAQNDAKAAAWGEYLAGAGRGTSSMIMITLGTGIGGGIILDGKILEGFNAAAGEIGHMVIRSGGRSCSCGRKGCFEAYASATALLADAWSAAEAHKDSLLWTSCNGQKNRLHGKHIFSAASLGDPQASQVLSQYISFLAEGTANLINIFQPELVCIGGGISGAGEQLLEPLKRTVAPLVYSRSSEKNARLVTAMLGNDAGLIGAACL